MNISKVISFLVAGIVIGAILFFAGFGILNLFKGSPDAPVEVESQTAAAETPVNPPTIEVTPNSTPAAETVVSGQTEGEGNSRSPIKIKPLNAETTVTEEEEPLATVAFGTLTLSTVNSVNNEPLNADFLIQNAENVAIALVKDTATSTLSLPVGDYKITVSQGEQKVVRFLGVKEDQNGSEVFELEAPVLTGEAQAPEVVGEVEKESETSTSETGPVTEGEGSENTAEATEATTTEATESAQAPASSESNGDAETDNEATENEATAATTATSSSAESNASETGVGGLRVSALTQQGKRPIAATFYIQRPNGDNVQTFRNVKTQQVTLPAGKYKITAKTDTASLVKQVDVVATKGIHEIFLLPKQTASENSSSQTPPARSAASQTEKNEQGEPGRLELFAQKASNNSPLKSNFYVQMPNGKMVASKIYVDSIGYKLPAGKYKVIVRATGYNNESMMLTVRSGQVRRQVFKLDVANASTAGNAPRTTATAPTARPSNRQREYGGLTVNIVSASNGAPLPADIVITRRDGVLLKQTKGLASASFDLPPQEYLIRVTHNGFTSNHQVNIVAGKLAIKTISFDTQRATRRERQQRQERAQ